MPLSFNLARDIASKMALSSLDPRIIYLLAMRLHISYSPKAQNSSRVGLRASFTSRSYFRSNMDSLLLALITIKSGLYSSIYSFITRSFTMNSMLDSKLTFIVPLKSSSPSGLTNANPSLSFYRTRAKITGGFPSLFMAGPLFSSDLSFCPHCEMTSLSASRYRSCLIYRCRAGTMWFWSNPLMISIR